MEIFFKSVNIWQSYKQNRDYLVIILKGGESRGGEKREGVHALPSEEKRKLGAYESMDKQRTDLWFVVHPALSGLLESDWRVIGVE